MKEIIIYGAGNMGKAVCRLLEGKCKIVCVLDRNPVLENTFVDGKYPVINPGSKMVVGGGYEVVVAMTACTFTSIKIELMKMGYKHIFTAGEFVTEMYMQENIYFTNLWHLQSAVNTEVYTGLFHDGVSKTDWMMAYEWFASGKETNYLVKDREKYFPKFLKPVIDNCRVMLDTAALDGEYISKFLEDSREKRAVYALLLNPPTIDYDTLSSKYTSEGNVHLFRYEAGEYNGTAVAVRVGMMVPFTSLEAVEYRIKKIDDMDLPKFDYMRCYSMSRVEPILKGSYESIVKYRPIIAVNIGHYESDFIRVPMLLRKMCKNYKFYLRLHSYQGNDCIMYALPMKHVK